MTREEAEKYAENMTYREAIYNLMQAKSVPYRKATFIKVNELLDELEQEQEPRKGYWQVVSDGYSDNAYICECSECKDTVWVYKDADRKWNYCPNCGADMREVKE